MYEEKERKINWFTLLKRILWYLLIVIVILGIVALITRCARNSSKNKKPKTTIDLSNEVLKLQNAAIEYITIDNLPVNENETRSLKLKYLIAKDAISPLKDSEGNVCSTSDSYVEITRLTHNYLLVTKVKCGKNSKEEKTYIGCFENCNGGICLGNEENTGICEEKVVEEPIVEEPTTTTTRQTTTKRTSKSTTRQTTTSTSQTTLKTVRRSTTTKKANTTKTTPTTKSTKTTKPTQPTQPKPTNPPTTPKPTNPPTTPKPTNPPTTPPKTCYKHRKYTCSVGTLSGSKCVVVEKKDTKKTQVGSPETIRNGTFSTPSACFGAPNGQIYECVLDRVDWSSLEPFIYIKTVYRLCTSPYKYDSSINKCVKTTTSSATPVYIWSYNSYVSGYTKIGTDEAWHCK